jgi:16S rRNA (adenine1518-N6/adenine1519-N6)-dimethyltransferase
VTGRPAKDLSALFGGAPFRPRKSQGQNFLVDPEVLDRIGRTVDCPPGDLLLEVGGGTGNLTERLLGMARPLLVIEKDPRLHEFLERRFMNATAFQLIRGDILELDVASFAPLPPGRIVLVGNIPYYLTSPLLAGLLTRTRGALRRMYLMIQKEVADRLQARPGTKEWGALSVCAQYHSDVTVHFPVKASSFKPRPKVESAFVSLEPRERLPLAGDGEEAFFRMVRAIFQSRRKTLWNSLKLLGRPVERVRAAIGAAGLSPEVRGETLDLERLMKLSTFLDG